APFLGALGVLPAIYFLIPRSLSGRGLADVGSSRPTAEEIVQAVGRRSGGVFTDQRHVTFCKMFQQRYRNLEQAVGIKFLSEGKIKAMYAPIIPRWDMAEVGCEVRREAEDVFKRPYEVDLYETYITAPMKKVGELRADSHGRN